MPFNYHVDEKKVHYILNLFAQNAIETFSLRSLDEMINYTFCEVKTAQPTLADNHKLNQIQVNRLKDLTKFRIMGQETIKKFKKIIF